MQVPLCRNGRVADELISGLSGTQPGGRELVRAIACPTDLFRYANEKARILRDRGACVPPTLTWILCYLVVAHAHRQSCSLRFVPPIHRVYQPELPSIPAGLQVQAHLRYYLLLSERGP